MTAIASDLTTDPTVATWVPAGDPDFPLANLPYGAVARGSDEPHLAVAIGDHALDLHVLARAGLLDATLGNAREVLCVPTLDALLARGRPAWRALRERVWTLLRADDDAIRAGGLAPAALIARADVACRLPFRVGAYVDFYASLEHATNLSRILRPGEPALAPNWRWLPVGYHGRASTVACGEDVVMRPSGQRAGPRGRPVFAPTCALDYEAELGFVTGDGPAGPLSPAAAHDVVFGVALLCDWSARDVQAWEYRPLGPFLSKSFHTSLSPWLVTLDALEPYRVAAPAQEPPPLPHLAEARDGAFDVAVDVALASRAMRERGLDAQVVSRVRSRDLYWTIGQQLAHVASNGTRVRAGDLYGSGTISGADDDAVGSLIELTRNGARPLALADGTTRRFLEDGDRVRMRASASRAGRARIGFGELAVTVCG